MTCGRGWHSGKLGSARSVPRRQRRAGYGQRCQRGQPDHARSRAGDDGESTTY